MYLVHNKLGYCKVDSVIKIMLETTGFIIKICNKHVGNNWYFVIASYIKLN